MPTRVFLLRHAETADPRVFHGAESDVGLSDKGRRQAEAIAPVLAALKPDVVISSAMRRALDTAGPIARACGLPVRVVPELHERRVGVLSGTPNNDPDGAWPQTMRRWCAGETHYAHEGAESFDAIRARVVPVWERLTREHAGKTVVIVAHGIVCKVLLLSLLAEYTVADWPKLSPVRNVCVSELLQTATGWEAARLLDWPAEVRALEEDPREPYIPA
jgi:broad specificity phosphatase PhoE